jgi:excisionase family DNA binding protein
MANQIKPRDYLTTTQAARLLSVSPDTVLKWVKAGKVKSYRTLGGHFRIPSSELGTISTEAAAVSGAADGVPVAAPYKYCWEFLAGGDQIKDECKDCITFRSRARRCYELKELPGGLGCLNVLCDTECTNCEYYRLVHRQGLSVLILGKSDKLVRDASAADEGEDIRVRRVASEYEAAAAIQGFRPDYIVVDCAFGKRRTSSICNSLFCDVRIPVARIILCSRDREVKDYCDKEVFGWIRKPFDLQDLRDYIRGIPEVEYEV